MLNGFTPMWEQAPPAGLCMVQVDVYEKDGSWGMTWVKLADVGVDGTFRNVSWDEGLERWVAGDTADFSIDYELGMKAQGEPVAWKRHDDREDNPRRKTPEQKAREAAMPRLRENRMTQDEYDTISGIIDRLNL